MNRRFLNHDGCYLIVTLALFAVAAPLTAEEPPTQLVRPLGGAGFSNWTGLKVTDGDGILNVPGEAIFKYPDSEGGDWSGSYGLSFDAQVEGEGSVYMDISLLRPTSFGENGGTASIALQGSGWKRVLVPWKDFSFRQAYSSFWGKIEGLRISAKGASSLSLRNIRVVHGAPIWMRAPIRGQSVEAGQTAEYEVLVGNAADTIQGVAISVENTGYDSMAAIVEPAALSLAPGEVKSVVVRVTVPERIPPGGREVKTLRTLANGQSCLSGTVELVTARRVAHPNILQTAEGWDEIRQKVVDHDWAKEEQRKIVEGAAKWNVPKVRNEKDPKLGDWLFRTQVEHDLMAAGKAYQLTRDKVYAEKVRTFMLRLSDPANGFPVTRRGCHQASVQEGHFFQHIALAYDMALSSGVFTEEDRRQIDATLRLFVGSGELGGQISNWNVSSLTGALYCSLVVQDLAMAERFLFGPGGIIDQLRAGTLDDGWWYELSISYNTWVASEFSQAAIAMRPWGLDLAGTRFPAYYRSSVQRHPEKTDYGATDAQWGPITRNWIDIKRMWDVLPAMVDYRGVMFGLNDSAERRVTGEAMELAYYLYRDPAYAAVIKRGGGKRDLIYGVPELPESNEDPSAKSTVADNAGVAVLRSTAEGKPPRERIQAVLRYGDHGWYHGHFDRGDLVHLSRYGRSFYNPEFIWYGYPSYMYKFYVQTSVSKNMVVVDQKMQEPTENRRLLFHSGPMMQAAAVDVSARWSNPPYGGINYGKPATFAEKMLEEGRSIPLPEKQPPYASVGSLTSYTEPITQRRLTVVTDDYVVLADFVKGEQEHTYDSVFQMKNFQGLEAPKKHLARHTGQWNPDPLGSAQFVTDCDWYQVTAPARGSYRFQWEKGQAGENEPGILNLDLHTLWPPQQEIMLGTPPETQPVARKVDYFIRGDGEPLEEGNSGIWILGEQIIDVAVKDVKILELETKTGATNPKTLFWANARLVTSSGKEIPLSDLTNRLTAKNVAQPKEPGQDFAGGPIKIAGVYYTQAQSAQPENGHEPASVSLDISQVDAVRFKATLGGDFPLGNESQQRKTVAIRFTGKEARFLTIIEPFEDKRVIKSAMATGPDEVRVELLDGRVQEIRVSGLTGPGDNLSVQMKELLNGKVLREETTLK